MALRLLGFKSVIDTTCQSSLVESHSHGAVLEAVLYIGSSSCCVDPVFQLPETPLRVMTDQRRRTLCFLGMALYPGSGYAGHLDLVTQAVCSGGED